MLLAEGLGESGARVTVVFDGSQEGAGARGKRQDGCAGIVDCGGCPAGQACGVDEPGTCGAADTLRPADVRAMFGGQPVCGCFLDDRNQTVGVSCDPGKACEGGLCK